MFAVGVEKTAAVKVVHTTGGGQCEAVYPGAPVRKRGGEDIHQRAQKIHKKKPNHKRQEDVFQNYLIIREVVLRGGFG